MRTCTGQDIAGNMVSADLACDKRIILEVCNKKGRGRSLRLLVGLLRKVTAPGIHNCGCPFFPLP